MVKSIQSIHLITTVTSGQHDFAFKHSMLWPIIIFFLPSTVNTAGLLSCIFNGCFARHTYIPLSVIVTGEIVKFPFGEISVLVLFSTISLLWNQTTVGGGRPFGGEHLNTTVSPGLLVWLSGWARKTFLIAVGKSTQTVLMKLNVVCESLLFHKQIYKGQIVH